jgi:adenine-specific DNA-methyltransferase
MANTIQLQAALQKPYDTILFGKDVLSQVFGSGFTLNTNPIPVTIQPNQTEKAVIHSVFIYGNINLEDGTEITCYEVVLQPSVRIEHSRVAIQHYVRKLLTAGQMAIINFIPTELDKVRNLKKGIRVWRLTLVAKDSELTDEGIKEKVTHAKRYTYLLGPSETCRTPAQRLEKLSIETNITFQKVREAFEVEKLSDEFFEEYTRHYERFCKYLQESNFRKSVFKISITKDARDEERDKAFKPIRDFVKKLLGRIVFLYFVQKKGWLGAKDTNYKDGLPDFIKQLFLQSGGNDSFYSNSLTVLFFDTLNKERPNDDFKMPDGEKVKVPFLNGGLFDQEEFDDALLTIPAKLFHNQEFYDVILDKKNPVNSRGFFDFLDSFNFTVYEDGPDDHTVAVDPEMMGHIFENLLEDNKDKGTFYTPKEIVHYMCEESLIEYLATHLKLDVKEERTPLRLLVKDKEIENSLRLHLGEIDTLLDSVKICDPAIGSGAFPMGLLQEIHSIKEVVAFALNREWKPAEVKENIIQNSIYGVDIEKGAVDIARLRFWLSLVVDEDKPRALPNLDYKIVVGDSLVSRFEGEIIEIDWERKQHTASSKAEIEGIQQLLKEIAQKQRDFFKPSTKNKKNLQSEIRRVKLELLIKQLSLNKKVYESKHPLVLDSGLGLTTRDRAKNDEIIVQIESFQKHLAKLEKLKKDKDEPFEHFDWQLDFPEILNPSLVGNDAVRGFDIVIGNPPYGARLTREDKNYLIEKYPIIKGQPESYEYFLFRALTSFTSSKGITAFIIPTNFIESKRAEGLRDTILQSGQIMAISNFRFNVWKNNAAETLIFVHRRNATGLTKVLHPKTLLEFKHGVGVELIDQDTWQQTVAKRFIIRSNTEISNKITSETVTIDQIAYVGQGIIVYQTRQESAKNLHISDKPKGTGNWVKLLDTESSLEPFKVNWGGNFLNYGKWLWRAREEKYFTEPKILFIRLRNKSLSRKLIGAFDEERFYNRDNFNNIIQKDPAYSLKYVLALFNSTLINYWYKSQFDNVNINPEQVRMIPIKIAESSLQKRFITLVDYVQVLKRREIKESYVDSMTSYFERIIDAAVYDLYFHDLIKSAECEVLKHLVDLPTVNLKLEPECFRVVKDVYVKLTSPNHPVDAALLKLNNVLEVQIVEGKQ